MSLESNKRECISCGKTVIVGRKFAKSMCHSCYMKMYVKTTVYKEGRRAYDNSPKGRATLYKNRTKYREKLRQEIDKYKLSKGCIDCGYRVAAVALDFDHLSDKKANIPSLVNGGWAVATVWAEVAKCEVRCANCHRIVTKKRRMELEHKILL